MLVNVAIGCLVLSYVGIGMVVGGYIFKRYEWSDSFDSSCLGCIWPISALILLTGPLRDLGMRLAERAEAKEERRREQQHKAELIRRQTQKQVQEEIEKLEREMQ